MNKHRQDSTTQRPTRTPRRRSLQFARRMALIGFVCVVAAVCWKSFPIGERETTIGVEGRVEVTLPRDSFVAVPYTHGDPLVVRVASVSESKAGFVYDLRYQLYSPGDHDLRYSLIDEFGAQPQEAIAVSIDPLLEADHSGQLFSYGHSRVDLGSSYFFVMRALTLLWAVALLPLVFYGRHSEEAQPERASVPPPAERVRSLLEIAQTSPLDAHQRADLEMLLLHCWASRSGAATQRLANISESLRRCGEKGKLLRDLEQWIHAPQNAKVKMSPELLDALERSCEEAER